MHEYVLIVLMITGPQYGSQLYAPTSQSATFANEAACKSVRDNIRRVIATAPGVRFLAAECYPKSKEDVK